MRAAWQREIGRTDKSQRSRILTKIHQNNVELYTKRKEARIDLYGMDGTLKQIEDDSAACKWALNYYQLTIFEGIPPQPSLRRKHPFCRALTSTTTLQFKIGEEGESFLMKGRTQKIRQM